MTSNYEYSPLHPLRCFLEITAIMNFIIRAPSLPFLSYVNILENLLVSFVFKRCKSIICCVNRYKDFGKWTLLIKLSICISCESVILLWNIYLRETLTPVHRNICTEKCIAAAQGMVSKREVIQISIQRQVNKLPAYLYKEVKQH